MDPYKSLFLGIFISYAVLIGTMGHQIIDDTTGSYNAEFAPNGNSSMSLGINKMSSEFDSDTLSGDLETNQTTGESGDFFNELWSYSDTVLSHFEGVINVAKMIPMLVYYALAGLVSSVAVFNLALSQDLPILSFLMFICALAALTSNLMIFLSIMSILRKGG